MYIVTVKRRGRVVERREFEDYAAAIKCYLLKVKGAHRRKNTDGMVQTHYFKGWSRTLECLTFRQAGVPYCIEVVEGNQD